MEHPKIEDVNKNIVYWIQENFKKAILQFRVDKDTFEFARVSTISKIWMEKDYWTVNAMIEYGLGGQAHMKTLIF